MKDQALLNFNHQYHSIFNIAIFIKIPISACDEGPGLCALLITLLSCLLIIVSLPLSLCCVIKVVQVGDVSFLFSALIYV